MKENILRLYRLIFCRNVFSSINTHVYKLALRGMGVLNSGTPKETGEEYFLKNVIAKIKPKIIFEVGANDGGYSQELSKFAPSAMIYAFEPNPETFKKLRKNVNSYKNIKIYNLALSDKIGTDKLWDFADNSELKYTQPTSTLASMNREVINELYEQKAKFYRIKVSRIDYFCSQNKIKTIDFLKIDTEGTEFKVLMGAKKCLEDNNIKVILFEFNEMNVYTRIFLKDFIDILRNYNIFRLLPSGMLPITDYQPKIHEIFAYQNIVAINKYQY